MDNFLGQKGKDFIRKNNVTVMFIILCLAAFFVSGTKLTFLLPELFTRIGRNSFLVLSLIIPVIAGLGLNFSIVIGAASAQIAIFLIVLWDFKGMPGIVLCVLISTVLSTIFGYLIGKLFNSMKGTEMVGGLVAGYFSDGIYQLLFLFVLGGIIPITSKKLMISTGVGVKNTINLDGTLKYAIDEVPFITIIHIAVFLILIISVIQIVIMIVKNKKNFKNILIRLGVAAIVYALTFIPFISDKLQARRLLLLEAIDISAVLIIIFSIIKIIQLYLKKELDKSKIIKYIFYIVLAVLLFGSTYIKPIYDAALAVKLPVFTYICILGLCSFIPWLMKTKLGQEMRTVGHSREVAASAGINVDNIRIIAIIMSTVLASYGQLISLQNIGTVATYGSHQQVGLYAIAALLVGGASVQKANVKQAILGVVLFHTLFILSPIAGKMLIGNAQIGEYFRVFVAYGVIALSLAMHAWNAKTEKSSNA